ncbi:hypothetical protein L1281_002365 [Neisseria sp. HSC-16F19]|nr:hypothetical protein [Neisseria sp. HSC-16F19]MCP2041749.1 hypothetical protein [Neisseria sp. HSC-16F19]
MSQESVSPYTTTASLLATTWLCLPFNILLAAAALWQGAGLWQTGITVVLALAVLWLHIRVDFDRRVFAAWQAGQGDADRFDADLQLLGLGRPGGRTATERCRGALRWWKRLLWATVAQGVWLLVLCI